MRLVDLLESHQMIIINPMLTAAVTSLSLKKRLHQKRYSVMAITLRYVFALSRNASTLMRKVIPSYSYRSELIEIVIASYRYHSDLIRIVIPDNSYRSK